jgi:hypothetical protein
MPLNKEAPKIGDPLSVKWLLEVFGEVVRVGKFRVVAPLTIHSDEGGIRMGVDLWPPIWIRITSAGAGADSGKYAWTRVIPVPGGGWENAPDGKTGLVADDPAIEVNSNASAVLTSIFRAWRDPVSNGLMFQAGTC